MTITTNDDVEFEITFVCVATFCHHVSLLQLPRRLLRSCNVGNLRHHVSFVKYDGHYVIRVASRQQQNPWLGVYVWEKMLPNGWIPPTHPSLPRVDLRRWSSHERSNDRWHALAQFGPALSKGREGFKRMMIVAMDGSKRSWHLSEPDERFG